MRRPPPSCFLGKVLPLVFCAPAFAQQPPPAQPPPAQPPPQTPPAPKPGQGLQWLMGDTTVKLGGYVKLDLIHDFDAIGSAESFDPRTIPTDGTEGSNTRMQAQQSRLNLDVRGPASSDPYRFFIEGDFFGSGGSFRLRHAYVTLDEILGGQTWTTFMDDDAMPETLDFESPIGFPQIRQAQVRYAHESQGGNEFAVAIEDPASAIVPPTGVPGHAEEVLPDIDAHYTLRFHGGHVQLGAFGGMASFRPDGGSSDSVALWGLNLSTRLEVGEQDSVILQGTYGDGVGRYRGGITAAPDANGDLEAITTTAFLGSYEHHWSEAWRSTVMYSWASGDMPAGTPLTTSEKLEYAAANLIWQFSPRAWTGVEWLYGTNQTFDGNDGDATRLQFSLRFNL